jgi:hypothetical protein
MQDVNNTYELEEPKNLAKSKSNGEDGFSSENAPEEGAKNESETSSSSSYLLDENGEIYYTSEWLKNNTVIRGWLSFFLFMVVIGGLFGVAYPIFTFNLAEYDNNILLALSDPLFGLMLFLLACYTFHAFLKRQPNAVFLAKMYLIAVFASNLLTLIGGEYELTGFGSVTRLVRSLIWCGIWFAFLLNSTNVEEVCPEDYRRIKKLDKYIVTAFIVFPLLVFAVVLLDISSTNSNHEENLLQNVVLKDNEFTDSKIVFTRPTGFSCHDTEVDGLKIYNLECEDVGSVTLCSDFEDNRSEQNVRTYWNNWEDEKAKELPSILERFESLEVNGHPYYYIVKRYTTEEGELYWRFIMMFDYETKKVCILSCYDGGSDEYVAEILSSIRFK